MNLILFVAKIFLCSGILFTYYWFFLRNKKFHHYNRFYLLAIVIISLVFPFIEIPLSEETQTVYPGMHQAIDFISVNNWEENLEAGSTNVGDTNEPILTTRNLSLFVYALGLLLLFVLLFKSLTYIIHIRHKYPSESIGDLRLYNTIEPGTPFSFFKSIFWNHQISFNSKEGQQIFRHELFHVRQHHSSDSLFMELVCIICWFNPFFHLIRKELKAIHEFLADQYAISDNDRYAYAELLVMESIRQKKISIVHPFFQNNIKRRIAMITKFQKTRYGYWSRVMALPILILLFCMIVLRAQQNSSAQQTNNLAANSAQTITVLIDAGHGGKDPGAYSPDNKYVEKDLALAISKKIKEKAASYNVKVIMTREDDNGPGIKARTDQAAQTRADLIVSIHVAAEPPTVVTANNNTEYLNGICIYAPKDGSANYKQSTLLANSILNSVNPVYKTYGIIDKKRTQIWIIDKAPCAAILVECGNIANKNDLEFISNEANQEKLAEAILKGIVNFKSTSSASHSTEQELNAIENSVTTETKGPNNSNLSEEQFISIQNEIKKYIAQHLMKTIMYPELARKNNQTTSIYFAVEVDEKGKIQMFDIITYSSEGKNTATSEVEIPKPQDIVIVGKPGDKSSPIKKVQSVAHDMWEKELDKSIKSYLPPTNIENIRAEKLYFRVVFTLEEEVAEVSIESVSAVGTQITTNIANEPIHVTGVNISSHKIAANTVNVKTNFSDPVVTVGHQLTTLNSTPTVNLTNVEVVPVVVQGNAGASVTNTVNEAVTVQEQKKVPPRNEPLPIDLIRKFKVGETTLDFVKQQLGQASNQFMDSYVESLAYYGSNERLMLTFSREDGRLVNYSYFLDRRTKTTLNYDDVKAIEKGTTTFKDLLRKFGKPSEIHIDNNTESWAYLSDNARLSVMTHDKLNAIVNQMSFDNK